VARISRREALNILGCPDRHDALHIIDLRWLLAPSLGGQVGGFGPSASCRDQITLRELARGSSPCRNREAISGHIGSHVDLTSTGRRHQVDSMASNPGKCILSAAVFVLGHGTGCRERPEEVPR
jgi:hypothetical protein